MLYFAPWKTVLVMAVVLIGLLFSLPNFIPETARLNAQEEPVGVWTTLPHQTVNLGLDLRGGSHLAERVGANTAPRPHFVGLGWHDLGNSVLYPRRCLRVPTQRKSILFTVAVP